VQLETQRKPLAATRRSTASSGLLSPVMAAATINRPDQTGHRDAPKRLDWYQNHLNGHARYH